MCPILSLVLKVKAGEESTVESEMAGHEEGQYAESDRGSYRKLD